MLETMNSVADFRSRGLTTRRRDGKEVLDMPALLDYLVVNLSHAVNTREDCFNRVRKETRGMVPDKEIEAAITRKYKK